MERWVAGSRFWAVRRERISAEGSAEEEGEFGDKVVVEVDEFVMVADGLLSVKTSSSSSIWEEEVVASKLTDLRRERSLGKRFRATLDGVAKPPTVRVPV